MASGLVNSGLGLFLEQIALTHNHSIWYFCSVFCANKFEYIQIYPEFNDLKSNKS